MTEAAMQVPMDRAFLILKECYANLTIELQLTLSRAVQAEAQLAEANAKIAALTPKPVVEGA